MESRVCAATGLGLVSSPDRAFRIAKTSYGPLSAIKRVPLSDGRKSWSRFDTRGRTIYAADSVLTAYLELIAPYLDVVADHRARHLDEREDTASTNAMKIPRRYREGLTAYTLEFPEGWWVEIDSVHTLNGLADLFTDGIRLDDNRVVKNFTSTLLSSDKRELTTEIATVLRHDVTLDDGSQPLGVYFTSKHARTAGENGGCWAYWQRDVDNGHTEPARVVRSAPIRADDTVLK